MVFIRQMLHRLRYCCAVVLLLFTATARGEVLPFHLFQQSEGLPDNCITALQQLPDGRMVMRTPSVLAIYDGYDYEYYPFPTAHTYYWSSDNQPPAIYLDSEQRIWDKQHNVLCVFDVRRECFIENVDSLLRTMGVTDRLDNIFMDASQRLWMVQHNGQVVVADGNHYTTITKRSHVGAMPLGINGRGSMALMALADGTIIRWDTQLWHQDCVYYDLQGLFNADQRVVFAPLPTNDVWMMWDNGLAFYRRSENRWTAVDLSAVLPQGAMLTAMDTDAQGNAMVGTNSRMLLNVSVDSLKVKPISVVNDRTLQSLTSDITAVVVDDEHQGLWISLLDQGAGVFYSSTPNMALLAAGISGTMSNKVSALAESNDGTILVGTYDGLLRYDPQSRTFSKPYDSLSHVLCLALYSDSRGRTWLCTFNDGLFCLLPDGSLRHYGSGGNQRASIFVHGEPNTSCFFNIVEDGKHRLWTSAQGGVCRFDDVQGTFQPLKRQHPQLASYNDCRTMAVDADGRLVIGSTNGLYVYDADADSVSFPSPRHASNWYSSIVSDHRGLYWFCTRYGLSVADPESHRTWQFTTANGLPHNVVASIVETDSSHVVVTTQRGMTRVKVEPDTADGWHFSFHNASGKTIGGMGCFEAGTVLKSTDGTLYLGTNDGLIAMSRPVAADGFMGVASEASQTAVSSPLISVLKVMGQPLHAGKQIDGKVLTDIAIPFADRVVLSHTQNYLSFEFSLPRYDLESVVRYRYRLEGLESVWHEEQPRGQRGSAFYTALPHGKYRFVVYATVNEGDWGEPAVIDIVINPPFWLAWWAYILYAVLLALLVWLVLHLWTLHRRMRRSEEFQREIVVTPTTITVNSPDTQFVQKALECVERNMDNEDYTVEELSSDMATTRTTLYRHLQRITGQTPLDFMRSIRMKRAAQLLRDTDMTVQEVAGSVGICTPRYFSKQFKDTFGVLPSEYRQQVRGSSSACHN